MNFLVSGLFLEKESSSLSCHVSLFYLYFDRNESGLLHFSPKTKMQSQEKFNKANGL